MDYVKFGNLILRFIAELAALVAAGYWGFSRFDDIIFKLLWGFGVPFLMAAAWGIFRVPGDGGAPIVAVGGQIRLGLEISYFVLAIYLLAAAGRPVLATIFAMILLVNYAMDYERVWSFAVGKR
ncbi:YrdB family protein [Nitratireductor sp. ZSWI3]|uniref:YrdB family protein n=1 Tax=Nitratireductor sp. ZSWI3 TaxID=2966359 RepID=UPI0021505DF2|nr:YrdB family protein [Nitratireductor sp. ZSWI3]MCR4267722.1 YrdB family protein [Nitratireductor sp. ZSWI3]